MSSSWPPLASRNAADVDASLSSDDFARRGNGRASRRDVPLESRRIRLGPDGTKYHAGGPSALSSWASLHNVYVDPQVHTVRSISARRALVAAAVSASDGHDRLIVRRVARTMPTFILALSFVRHFLGVNMLRPR